MMPVIVLVSALTFLHYVGAQMRAAPVLPLYAAAHGATATGVGIISGAHVAVAAVGSVPLGRAADTWGRRPLLLGGMVVGAVTSLLLPLVEREWALAVTYGLAGFGVAAFTPSALSMVGDAAVPGKVGSAFAWYSTAHYGAVAIGPFLRGLVAHQWGLALGALAPGPVITTHGYAAGFAVGGVAGVLGALIATVLWARARTPREAGRRAPQGG